MYYLNVLGISTFLFEFLRIEFICIIWTVVSSITGCDSSWGLNLFVLFELATTYQSHYTVLEDWIYLYYLNSMMILKNVKRVLEDWIYLYYLNGYYWGYCMRLFLRIEFICIIWTMVTTHNTYDCSWGLNLFVLFEPYTEFNCRLAVLEDWIYLYYLNY